MKGNVQAYTEVPNLQVGEMHKSWVLSLLSHCTGEETKASRERCLAQSHTKPRLAWETGRGERKGRREGRGRRTLELRLESAEAQRRPKPQAALGGLDAGRAGSSPGPTFSPPVRPGSRCCARLPSGGKI